MAGALSEEVLKRIKALRKKHSQIEKLKARGGQFTEEEQTKVNSEERILAEIEALESGKEVPAYPEASGGQAAKEPIESEAAKPPPEEITEVEEPESKPAGKEVDLPPLEAEKRIRAIKKKLTQISKLKEKGGGYSKEEADKVAAEPSLMAECTELEIGLLDPEPKKAALTAQKKLEQIAKLRARGSLTAQDVLHVLLGLQKCWKWAIILRSLADCASSTMRRSSGPADSQEREKVNKEASLKKELAEILGKRVPLKDPTPKEAPAAKPAVEAQQPAKPAAPTASPAPQQQAAYSDPPVSLGEGVSSAEDDAQVAEALAQAFAQEDMMEEEGFLESRASTKKRAIQAKAQAKAAELKRAAEEAAARQQQEQEEEQRRQEEWRRQEEQRRQAAAAAARQLEQEQQQLLLLQQQQEQQQRELQQREEQEAQEAQQREQEEREEERRQAAAAATANAPCEAASLVPEKQLRALKKKIAQIEKLKARGGEYTAEEREKLGAEANMLAEIAALERGETRTPPAPADPIPETAAAEEEGRPVEPAAPPASQQTDVNDLSPAEAEKRLKALRKKVAQIGKLRERGAPFSEEEAVKIASQPQILKDIKRLEAHLT